VPKDKDDIQRARRSLLKLTASYTLEFAWIMSRYQSFAKECVKELVGTPTMKAHLANYWTRLEEIFDAWT
jgi:hypothetical protein